MSVRKTSIDGKQPFAAPEAYLGGLELDVAARMAMVAGDIALILDESGRIVDFTGDLRHFPGVDLWIGHEWLDTVSVESRAKVMEMLAHARKGVTQHWRQVNQVTVESDIPLRFVVVPLGERRGFIAFGRDIREAAALQQRLLQAQQSLERDYLRLRQVESRYRLLFEQTSEAVMIIDSDSFRIRESNLAAHEIFRSRPGALQGGKFTALFSKSAREQVIAYLGSAMVSHSLQPIEAEPADGGPTILVTASGFRERGGQFLLVRLSSALRAAQLSTTVTARAIEAMPDAFVLTDARLAIREANAAFVELIGAASADQLRGQPLEDFVGRPGVDLDLIEGQLAKHESVRNVATVVGARDGFDGEPVELSAVRAGGDQTFYGFVIRPIGRRLRDLPPTSDSPRSVEQLTELVGRMSLKDIVRESTDLIERLCIEAALEYTSNNRASAAEILGLSRQSLYSKLNRYGLGSNAEALD